MAGKIEIGNDEGPVRLATEEELYYLRHAALLAEESLKQFSPEIAAALRSYVDAKIESISGDLAKQDVQVSEEFKAITYGMALLGSVDIYKALTKELTKHSVLRCENCCEHFVDALEFMRHVNERRESSFNTSGVKTGTS